MIPRILGGKLKEVLFYQMKKKYVLDVGKTSISNDRTSLTCLVLTKLFSCASSFINYLFINVISYVIRR